MNSQPEITAQYQASRKIDDLLTPGKRQRHRLGKLAREMLSHQGVGPATISNADAISRVLSPGESPRNQRFFAAVFLRLLSALPHEIHDLDHDRRLLVTKLLGRFPKIAKALSIDKKAQGYERLKAFESAADKVDEYLAEALAPKRSLAAFEQTRQRVMRLYHNPLVHAIAAPFLPDFLSKDHIGIPLGALHSHLTAPPRSTRSTYSEAKESLEAMLEDCTRHDTRYVREFFRPFFAGLLAQVTTSFESSPLNLPGDLSLTELGKKYPFTISGAEVRLTFAVENIGSGMAFDVDLAIDADDHLALTEPSQFLDQVDPSERLEPVAFPARVVETTDESVLVACALSWTDGDGTRRNVEKLVELPAQPGDIPWDELRYAEPYSLEPVTRAKDLVGRAEQTGLLISKLRAESVGSFFIFGQRRVGKTSVVATLEDMPDLKEITILNLETGGFILPDAMETIDNLGTKICTALLQRSPKLVGLVAPDFSGALAPLDDFLTAVFANDHRLRLVIVLDEFDALPPSLYRRGEVSHAFFTSLRALSAKPRLGFVLVGGEKMAEILSIQGEALNKFRTLRIDYLDKQSHWSDFVELVRKPVEAWATITDDAVTKLYEVTAGNPFFTKFVCTELVADMKRRRDAYVTAAEMERAIATAVDEAGINIFQHFWDDGVVATSDERQEQERASRRRVLSSLGEVLRSRDGGTLENVAKCASRFGLGEDEVRGVLTEFEKRKVLVQEEGEYSCKVRLFERWLVDSGVNELELTLVEEESLRAHVEAEKSRRVTDREVASLAETWGNYRGRQVTAVNVKAWLDQFGTTEECRIVFDLLKKLEFYSGGRIREKLREGHAFVRRELARRGVIRRAPEGDARKVTDNTLISFYGGEGKRGQTYAEWYVDENKIYNDRVVSPRALRSKVAALTDVSGIVFVDDFIGTGRTATRSLGETLEPMAEVLARHEVDVFLISVSGFAKAARKVERDMSSVVPSFRVSVCDPLDDSDRCFSERSAILPDSGERLRAEEVARTYGRRLFRKSPLGLGNCQALVVFEGTCPNNSLPILWATGSDDGWKPLFPRP